MSFRIAYLVVSDRRSQGDSEDTTGPAIAAWVETQGWVVAAHAVCPDDQTAVAESLRGWADDGLADLILTTGGTGLSSRDQTPEATRDIIEREVPGISEWIRASTGAKNRFAYLSRGVSGIRKATLIVNLPGSPRAVTEYLSHLERILPHALSQLQAKPGSGEADSHPKG